jgi:hypothetical protein
MEQFANFINYHIPYLNTVWKPICRPDEHRSSLMGAGSVSCESPTHILLAFPPSLVKPTIVPGPTPDPLPQML